ncbi:MAG: histidine kinase dimerization/phospho-acceptor domain-containing protein [Senegalia sp. (in: firmicutes)]
MATKLKKYSYSYGLKIIAFVIAITTFTSGLYLMFDTMIKTDGDLNLRVLFEDNYYQSNEFHYDVESIASDLSQLINHYKNEEYIKEGKTLNKDYLEERTQNLYYEFTSNSKEYNPNLSETENREKFREIYKTQIDNIKNDMIEDDLKEFNNIKERLNNKDGLIYFAKYGEEIFKNSNNITSDSFKNYPSYVFIENNYVSGYPEQFEENNSRGLYNLTHYIEDSSSKIYLGFTDSYLQPQIDEWQEDKKAIEAVANKVLILLVIFLVSFIYLIYSAGRKPEDDDIHLSFIDKIYTDINIILEFILIALWPLLGILPFNNMSMAIKLFIPVTALISTIGLLLLLSLIKHIKNKTIIKHSVIYIIGHKLFSFFKDVYNNGNVAVKVVLLVIGYPLFVVATFFMFPITIGLAAYLALRKVKEFNSIKEGVKKIKDGDLDHKINVSSNGEFNSLANDINSIADGLNSAVENEVKSERLKSELISNVSHDIRTPLTSIITYVDLLKREEHDEKTNEYIDVLDNKSQKLKVLTDDLFEASKANSGNIPVNLEKINLVSLISQGIGELDDRVQESDLEFKLNTKTKDIYVLADGKLLWRAIENLFSNVFKYALNDSRVYIDILENKENVSLTIKNISAYELNISPDELMERFKRGDESRNSPGSGLGLSIAKSLIELQNGEFDIEIDGDLFKVTLKLNKSE